MDIEFLINTSNAGLLHFWIIFYYIDVINRHRSWFPNPFLWNKELILLGIII